MKKALIVLLAVAFVAAFAMPAMAADKSEWSFYGNARLQTFSYDDDENANNAVSGAAGRFGNQFDDRDTTWTNIGNSRFGANVTAGSVTGQVEMRESTEWRIIWGEWDFGVGKLGVGKNYTPANMFYSNQAGFGEVNMLWAGGEYTGADPMIRLRFQGIADMIDFDLAFVDNAGAAVPGGFAGFYGAGNTDTDTTLPQIEARMLINWGALQVEVNGAWLSYEAVGFDGNNEREYDIDAWLAALGVKYAMGPFGFRAQVYTGENNSRVGQFLLSAANPTYVAGNDAVEDADGWGWIALANFKLNDMLTFEAGYGENQVDSNLVNTGDDENSTYYLQAVINPAQGVYIIPEIGEVDYQDDGAGNDEGDTFYFGAVWKIYY